MDARVDPAKYAGLSKGDAHVIRNAGGRASDDANGFHDVGTGPGSHEGAYIDWLTIADQGKSVTNDVQRIRRHPLVPKNIPIYGYIYDVTSGKLVEVENVTKPGAIQ